MLGIGGAAAASAALLAACRGRASSTAATPAVPSPYTPELEEAGIPHRVGARRRPCRRGSRRRARRALRRDEGDHRRRTGPPRAPRGRGGRASTSSSCQQLIADAAATRGLRTLVRRRDARQVHDLGMDRPPARGGGPRPDGVRRGAPAPSPHGGPSRPPSASAPGGTSSSRPTSTRATSTRIAPRSRVVLNADWDHPDVFADRTAVVDLFERWVRRFDGGGEAPVLVANAGDPGVRELLARLRDWPGRLVVFEVVGARRARGPDARLAELASAHATAAGSASALVATLRIDVGGLSDLTVHGLPGTAPAHVRLRLVGSPLRRRRARRRGRRARGGRRGPGRRGRARLVRGRGPAVRAQGRRRRDRRARRLRPPPDGDRGDARGGPAPVPGPARCGPCTSRSRTTGPRR